jgi:hypothetical protein
LFYVSGDNPRFSGRRESDAVTIDMLNSQMSGKKFVKVLALIIVLALVLCC